MFYLKYAFNIIPEVVAFFRRERKYLSIFSFKYRLAESVNVKDFCYVVSICCGFMKLLQTVPGFMKILETHSENCSITVSIKLLYSNPIPKPCLFLYCQA